MNKLGLNKIGSKRKGDRVMDRLYNSLNNHKNFKNKKQKNENSHSDNDLFIGTFSYYSFVSNNHKCFQNKKFSNKFLLQYCLVYRNNFVIFIYLPVFFVYNPTYLC